MNEVRTLFEKFWICKDTEKETYYKVKRDIPAFQRFVREQLGWRLVHTENILKLEKRPAHAFCVWYLCIWKTRKSRNSFYSLS